MRPRTRSTISNLDVTPLVDLTFILLITFMVTMPAIEARLKLPKMNAEAISDAPREEIVVNLISDGSILINNETIDKEQLKSYVMALNANDKDFTLRADASQTYGEVMNILKLIRSAGIDNVALATHQEK